jgi:hypothetical protein
MSANRIIFDLMGELTEPENTQGYVQLKNNPGTMIRLPCLSLENAKKYTETNIMSDPTFAQVSHIRLQHAGAIERILNDSSEVILLVNSMGGTAPVIDAIADVMNTVRSHQGTIQAFVTGRAHSAAGNILASHGDIQIHTTDATTVMWHPPYLNPDLSEEERIRAGNYKDAKDMHEDTARLSRRNLAILLQWFAYKLRNKPGLESILHSIITNFYTDATKGKEDILDMFLSLKSMSDEASAQSDFHAKSQHIAPYLRPDAELILSGAELQNLGIAHTYDSVGDLEHQFYRETGIPRDMQTVPWHRFFKLSKMEEEARKAGIHCYVGKDDDRDLSIMLRHSKDVPAIQNLMAKYV